MNKKILYLGERDKIYEDFTEKLSCTNISNSVLFCSFEDFKDDFFSYDDYSYVFVDIISDKMNEIFSFINKHGDEKKVILLADNVYDPIIDRLNKNILGCLRKPFDVNDFFNLIRINSLRRKESFNALDNHLKSICKNNENIIKGLFAVESNSLYTQISFYDSELNHIISEYTGINFELSEYVYSIIKKDGIFQDKINSKIFKNRGWWINHNLKNRNASLLIKRIDIKLFNRIETGVIIILSNEDVSEYINGVIDNNDQIKNIMMSIKTDVDKNITRNYSFNALINIIKNKDNYLYNHSFRTAGLSTIIAFAMGLEYERINDAKYSSLIHDLGISWIPQKILNKRDTLTDEEYSQIKKHTEYLEEIFQNNDLFTKYVDFAKYHHEKYDGSGYYGLTKDLIPIETQILQISDVFDSLISERPYRQSMNYTEAISYMENLLKDNTFNREIFNMAKELIIPLFDSVKTLNHITLMQPGNNFYISDPFNEKNYSECFIKDMLGAVLIVETDKNFVVETGMRLPMKYNLNGLEEIFNGKIIYKNNNLLTILIDSTLQKNKYEKIMWNKKIKLYKLPAGVKNPEHSYFTDSKYISADLLILFTDMISFASDMKFNIGDNLAVKFKAFGESIFIYGKIFMEEKIEETNRYWLKYTFNSEETKNHVNRMIFYRQLEIKTNF